ncbi:MAG: WYL domain-containing transcriptional regulator [Ignavibacteriales bacterium]|nr:WYL domain-containing transcriptional regulator [Ignavibacteriales bacterium]
MANIITATKRQVEILSLITQEPNKHSIVDIEARFNISNATAERDLLQLRSWGIAIHSIRGKLQLEKPLSLSQYRDALAMYVAFSSPKSVLQKSLTLLCEQMEENALPAFVTITKAIESRRVLKFSHYNIWEDKKETRTLNPYGISLLGQRWVVVGYANEHSELRHYAIESMTKIKLLEQTFTLSPQFNVAKYYENVFGVWHYKKTFDVKIQFDKSVAHIIQNRRWHTNQILKPQNDGSLIMEATVTSLHEMASWIMPWGKLAKVIEPKELKEKICNLCREILQNN